MYWYRVISHNFERAGLKIYCARKFDIDIMLLWKKPSSKFNSGKRHMYKPVIDME